MITNDANDNLNVESQRRPLLLADEENNADANADDTAVRDLRSPSLTLPLRTLFCFNGITLALPMTALLYVVNERVKIPLQLIPSYAAVAFLPCSLKPAYAHASSILLHNNKAAPRHAQISVLLVLSGVACAATALIPRHAVITCFAIAFVRCLFASWPEFLLGLTLIDEAVAHEHQQQQEDSTSSSYAVTVALFQSQAATARSIGCVIAHAFVLAFFCLLRWMSRASSSSEKTSGLLLNDTTVTILFFITGALNVVGAVVAWTCRIGDNVADTDVVDTQQLGSDERLYNQKSPVSRTRSYDSLQESSSDPLLEARSSTFEIGTQEPLLQTVAAVEQQDALATAAGSANIWLVVLLQVAVILLTMRQPVVHATSSLGWNLMAFTSILALLVVGCTIIKSASSVWQKQHSVGLFLILRNAVPSVSYLMSSYFYTIFATAPSFLQALSLLDMCITTAACWTYGKFLSKYSRDQQLIWLIAGTTFLAAATSLGNVALIRVLDPERSHFSFVAKVAVTIAFKTLLGFTSEWKFLPDLVLATVSVNAMAAAHSGTPNSSDRSTDDDSPPRSSLADECSSSAREQTASVGMQYGTLVSCIDFGGQLGALLAGPLVALVGTTRDNHWSRLDLLQEINSTMMLLSIAFLFILVRR